MVTTTEITRKFTFNDMPLADPNRNMSPEAVLRFYAPQYPALNNAQIEESGLVGSTEVFKFVEKVGTKA